MNTPQSPNIQLLSQQLFSGDPVQLEKALLYFRSEDRESLRALVTVHQDIGLFFPAMLNDLGSASGQLHRDFNNQFWRRTAIRALAATVDGIIFSFKRIALITAGLTGVQFDQNEVEFLLEQRMLPAGGKPRLPGFRDNLKTTFKLFAKAHGTPCPTDFGQEGFEALCATYEIRNRVTHPKSFAAFTVQDDETKRTGIAIEWLGDEFNRLLHACDHAVGNRSLPPQP
jgi:hypothetical protein